MTSDATLLTAWRNGDSSAGERLLDRYFRPLHRFFVNKVAQDTDDLIQETLMACVDGRDRIRDDDGFRSYVFGTARNVLRTYLRRRSRFRHHSDVDDHSVQDLCPGPNTLLRVREEHALLLEALRLIPWELQLILELHYWENMTTAEIAEVVDCPLGTARGRLARGRQKLLDALERMPMASPTRARLVGGLDEWAASLRAHANPSG